MDKKPTTKKITLTDESPPPKMSTTEWGLFIGALAVIDLLQILLDLIAIGFILNEFIDIFIGMAMPFYLHLRGQDMTKPQRWGGMVVGLLLEMIFDGTFPFWCLDGIYFFLLARREEKRRKSLIAKLPGGNLANDALDLTK